MKTSNLILAGVIGLLAYGSVLVSAQEQEPYVGSKAFEQMKLLVGEWEGTMDMGKGPETITATYKLTSGGSAIVETVFEGAQHEMVTVYHDNANRTLSMTHYCMLGNQPKMVLEGMENNELKFDLSEDADIDVASDTHMHSLALKFDGQNQMTQHWTEFKAGKAGKSVDIAFKRVK